MANNLWHLKRNHLIILSSAPAPVLYRAPYSACTVPDFFSPLPILPAFPSSTAECSITRDLKKLRLTLLTALKKLGLELLSQHIQTAAEAHSKIAAMRAD